MPLNTVEQFWLWLNDSFAEVYMLLLDANLRPFCCGIYREKTCRFKDEVARC